MTTVHALPATKNTQLRSVGHPWTRRKLSMIAAKATFVTALLAFAGLSPARVGAIAAIEVAGLLFIITIMEGRKRDTQLVQLQPERLAATFVFFLAGQGVVLALTGGLSRVTIADTGVGMNDVVMSRLGIPFFTTPLSFGSELEHGTTVRIDLPLFNTGGGHGHSLARG